MCSVCIGEIPLQKHFSIKPLSILRVKDMNKWIKSYVTEDLCELDSCSGGGGKDYLGGGDQAGYKNRGLGAPKSHVPQNFGAPPQLDDYIYMG